MALHRSSWSSILVFSFGLVIYRLPLLKARNELDSWMSREAAFLVNNWILLFSAFFVLFATMFPTLSEAVTGERLTVGPPFFNKWMVPIGLILLLLTGIGPLLAWRKSTLVNLRDSFLWPVVSAVVDGGDVRRARLPRLGCRACASRCARSWPARSRRSSGAARSVRRSNTGTDLLTALDRPRRAQQAALRRLHRPPRHRADLPRLRRRRLQAGRAGAAEARRRDDARRVTRSGTIALTVTDDGQKQPITAHIAVFRAASRSTTLYPAKWSFRKHEDEPPRPKSRSGAPSPRTSTSSSRAFDAGTQTSTLQIVVNPLVNWIWLGFGLMAFGTGIALLPERALLVRAREAAGWKRRRRVVLLAAVGCSRVGAARRAGPSSRTSRRRIYARNELETAAAARDRLHLRHLRHASRSANAAKIHARRGIRCAASWRRSSTREEPRRDHSRFVGRTAARRCSARPSTRASTGSHGFFRIGRRRRRRGARLRGRALVAARRARGAEPGRRDRSRLGRAPRR